MEQLWDITTETENYLVSHNFAQTIGYDGGMHKAYEWANNVMTIGLYYDRGYFDCNLLPTNEPRNSLPIVILLRYLNNDINFYKKELEEANLWNTLTTSEYFKLFFLHYDKIKDFFSGYNVDKYNEIQLFFEKKNAL